MPCYDMSVCFNCGVPCPESRTELSKGIPMEMSTAHALLNFEEIHKDVDDGNDGSSSSLNVSENNSSEETSRMILRSSRNN